VVDHGSGQVAQERIRSGIAPIEDLAAVLMHPISLRSPKRRTPLSRRCLPDRALLRAHTSVSA